MQQERRGLWAGEGWQTGRREGNGKCYEDAGRVRGKASRMDAVGAKRDKIQSELGRHSPGRESCLENFIS